MASTGTVAIKKVQINGVDFIGGFESCTIYEDITRNSWSGHIDIIDNNNYREDIPIIGEEFIIIKFASKQPVSGEDDDVISFFGKIHKLSNLREGHSSQKRYRLHFQSFVAEKNRQQRVRKSYSGTGTAIAKRIMDQQMNYELDVGDEAKWSHNFVFPNLTPFQCINYLSSISVSKKHGDPYYLFYEDREGFHMTTLSQLMDKGHSETINTKIIQNRKDPFADKILTSVIRHEPLFDTLENTDAGMYGNTLITYDKINKKYKELTKTYSETYDDFKHVSLEKLTRKREESPKNRFQFMMVNEPISPGVYSSVLDWGNQSLIRPPQIFGHRAQLTLNRSTNIKLGDVLDWDALAPKGEAMQADRDKIISGKWMVARIKHVFNHNNYNPHIEFIKDGIG